MFRVSYAARALPRALQTCMVAAPMRRMAPPPAPSAALFMSRKYFSSDHKETKEDEIGVEEGAGAEAEAEVGEVKVEDPTIALLAEIKDLKERVLRSLAEEANVRRIAKRDVDNAHAYANTSFAKAMLDVADDLERALGVVTAEDMKTADPKLTSIVQGIQMTDKNLSKIFAKFGVVSFGKIDDLFDPNMHDALYNIPETDKEKAGTVGQVVKTGYKLKDRVIRAAQVGARVVS
ncbi:GrpE-domain-containing protein [Ochromonadaceae sp. CCMP2298]|nr:GrpE-domain-containing protein [Ochromonadaceae sp. CCMP2298]|mmetsp:Transcript_14156/g.31256  ORF Transcript_14156/g.31256 Transcript_14156/m.31256 type:complete len:234 (-) Transcript_14156:237-938(-)|eukprot:CAMPEP_0173216734 /NCGR_PEP_ID=MMETSP1142-20121109/89_1 /TAXON_ID=483371 /ORGANISM="non described non described, Strain CCMP2298" /LENGTH=233 /DNA_ID=CAMNT_0014144205 /DNA_START=46 /DNA_END=747 /DNA_ORIENTATION=+